MCKFCGLHRGFGWQSPFVEPTKLTRCTAVDFLFPIYSYNIYSYTCSHFDVTFLHPPYLTLAIYNLLGILLNYNLVKGGNLATGANGLRVKAVAS